MAATMQKLLTVRLDEEFHQKVRMATIAHDTTMAEVVRAALEAWLAANPSAKAKKSEAAKKEVAKKPAKAAKAAKAEKPAKKSAAKAGGKKKKK